MFIKLNQITNQKTIDVRTKEEFFSMPLLTYNIPIINRSEHQKIKKMYPLAFFIIFLGFLKRKVMIKKILLEISENKKYPVVIGCSRGRLRSPFIYFYARSLGIKAYILSGGIRKYFLFDNNNLTHKILAYFDLD